MSRSLATKSTFPLLMLAVAFTGAWISNGGTTLSGSTPVGVSASNIGRSDTGLSSFRAVGIADSYDTAQWRSVSRTAGNVTYSYRYPPAWSENLTFCSPSAPPVESGHLPTGCVSTDILVGAKARDAVLTGGEELSINGHRAQRITTDRPASGLAERIYTVMVFDSGNEPIFGLSTLIGPKTDPAETDKIEQALDAIVRSIRVEVGK